MALPPLVLILLLSYLLLVAATLTVWFTLTMRRPPPSPRSRAARPEAASTHDEQAFARPPDAPKRASEPVAKEQVTVKHDAYRGANAKRTTAQSDDPFERFIRSKNDELDF
jgi:hypothetical protein